MAARELAAELQRATGVPAVPVFWAATDDADFAEASSTVIATASGAERLTLRQASPAGVPMSHARLGDDVSELFSRLAASVGSIGGTKPVLAAEATFRAGATMGDAYVGLLRTLLEGAGIAVLDASHPAVGVAARPHLEAALDAAPALREALVRRTDELRNTGFEAQVDVERELSLVFGWESGAGDLPVKRRLALGESAARSDMRLSPNVLLRPVLERQLLPTVAYLAGPGELAYFAQVSAVADTLGVARPLALPRWSGMIVPSNVDATLERLGVTLESLREPGLIEARYARGALPPGTAAALDDLRDAVENTIGRFDGLLTEAARAGARDQLAHRIERIERRLLAAVKRRDRETLRAVAAARGVVFPFGAPQERTLNAIPLLGRYGTDLGLAIRSACTAHARRLIAESPVHA
jgi:uncharacterized protein YllA (UPF0747 family)